MLDVAFYRLVGICNKFDCLVVHVLGPNIPWPDRAHEMIKTE